MRHKVAALTMQSLVLGLQLSVKPYEDIGIFQRSFIAKMIDIFVNEIMTYLFGKGQRINCLVKLRGGFCVKILTSPLG
jgi:hypothetical protein